MASSESPSLLGSLEAPSKSGTADSSASESDGAVTQSYRQSRIVDLVLAEGSLKIEMLAREFGVSSVTIYRDIAKLESLGLISRARGQIFATTSSVSEMPPGMRSQSNPEAKARIAKLAASLISEGNSVMVDDSSTVLPFVKQLLDIKPLTIITNAGEVERMVVPQRGITLISTGGTFSRWGDSFHGPVAVQTINGLHADFCVMSDAAVNGSAVCNPYDYVVETKRAMLAAAQTKILLVDATKFGRRALYTTALLSVFDIVVVDSLTPPSIQDSIKEQGCRLLVAD